MHQAKCSDENQNQRNTFRVFASECVSTKTVQSVDSVADLLDGYSLLEFGQFSRRFFSSFRLYKKSFSFTHSLTRSHSHINTCICFTFLSHLFSLLLFFSCALFGFLHCFWFLHFSTSSSYTSSSNPGTYSLASRFVLVALCLCFHVFDFEFIFVVLF